MASIYREIAIDVPSSRAWAALEDVGHADRLFAGVLVGCSLADGVRTVEFANGMVAKERIVTVDDERRRVVYSALNEAFVHHSSSMQIVPDGDSRCRSSGPPTSCRNRQGIKLLPSSMPDARRSRRTLKRVRRS